MSCERFVPDTRHRDTGRCLVATEAHRPDPIRSPHRGIGSGIRWCEPCATSRNFGQPGRPFTDGLAYNAPATQRPKLQAEQDAALIAKHFEAAGTTRGGLLVVHIRAAELAAQA